METKCRKSKIDFYTKTNTEFNEKQIPLRRLHYFFEKQCDADPDALAVVCNTEHLSYAELDAQANKLANYFVSIGIGVGNRVGILLDRSLDTYVTLLAVLKCGAAFVPLDPSFPEERVIFIAEDASLSLLVTTTKFKEAVATVRTSILTLDVVSPATAQQPATRVTTTDLTDELCYVIYTSGTTGRPKGVAVNHSNICNYLTVCSSIYKVTRDDRVYQGITITFDFAIEEIWMTFTAGATLVASPSNYQLVGADLAKFLIEHKVSVLGCVPTLLATVDQDVPSLRLLIVGGEVCPQDLVKRWSQPSRQMLNTYGPTETTITATWTELLPDQPVTIGKPLATYSVYILDEKMHPVPQGKIGEIFIGGLGVAQGYLNLPELTGAKFIPDPFEQSCSQGRMYRTGDLGRFTSNGEIEYLGRIDQQVKIRGYRIELTEIEAVLIENPEVENAIVSLVPGAIQELAAYITLRVQVADLEDFKSRLHMLLRRRLPSYMVPVFIEILDAIPTLSNGKADRSNLPKPKTQRQNFHYKSYIPPTTALEEELAKAWSVIFGHNNISVEDNFFSDLGGHSLFAALLISKLRQNPKLQHLSIADIYSYSTIRTLANHIKAASQTKLYENGTLNQKLRHSNLRVYLCGAVQMLLLYFLFAVVGIPSALVVSQTSSWSVVTVTVIPASWLLLSLVLPIAAKWLLIGRFRPGRYRLWGWYYCRWWLVRKIIALAPLHYLAGSPLMSFYLRLLGARIGKGCHIGTQNLLLPDLISIDDGASIGYNVEIHPFAIADGWLYQSPIQVGANAFVGTNSVLMLGSTIGQNSRILEQSLVARDQTIPNHETWGGSPSECSFNSDIALDEIATQQTLRYKWSPMLWVGFIAGFIILEFLPFMIAAPGWFLMSTFSSGGYLQVLTVAPLAGLLFVLTTCIVVAVGKKLIMPTAKPGIFPLHSSFGLRKWLTDHLMTLSLDLTYTLYATLYTSPWLRFLGAKVGSRAEVSTVSHIDPDLLTIGSESFVADLATVGSARYYNSSIAIAPTEIGKRCFVGNSALVPSNTLLGDGSLIGVHSLSPSQPIPPDSSWLGSPAIFLPRRDKCDQFDESLTFRPSVYMIVCRLAVEFLRILLPPTLLYLLITPEIQLMIKLATTVSLPVLIALIPAVFLSFALLATVLVAGLKWLVVGRYQPCVAPNWSHFIWRTELITGLYESIAAPWLLEWFTGTPILAVLLRLFGAKVGRRVYMETTLLTEFDLVYVGDDAAIAHLTSLQTHLFEDRVMKMSTVKIGRGCSIGPRSVVLYDSIMEAGSKLDGLSLVMKSEVLPSGSHWQGIPARLARGNGHRASGIR